MAIEVIRLLMLASQNERITSMTVTVATEVANYINNRKRKDLMHLESEGKLTVQVLGEKGVLPEYLELKCVDAEGHDVRLPDA
jgi:Ribonuclease G/E